MAAFVHRPVPSFVASLAVVLATLLPAAQGADKNAANPPPGTKAPRLLTPAQLRDCLAQKTKVGSDADRMAKAKSELGATQTEIENAGAALKDEESALDRTNVDAVAAYNAKVLERNTRIDDFQAKVAAYNREAETVLAAKAAFEKACANRLYDDRDMNDLQRKK